MKTALAIKIEKWIETNGPNGVAKLSAGSGVSTGTIYNVLRGKPVKEGMVRLLCIHMQIDHGRFTTRRSA